LRGRKNAVEDEESAAISSFATGGYGANGRIIPQHTVFIKYFFDILSRIAGFSEKEKRRLSSAAPFHA